MLRKPSFWLKERADQLMSLNKGFVTESNVQSDILKAECLVEAFLPPLKLEPISWTDEEPSRIIIKDAERTFTDSEFREPLIRVLTQLSSQFSNYHQGLSFIVAFLMLFHEDEVVVAIANRLNFDEKYIPGYWRHEALSFAVDAYLLDHLLHIDMPNIQEHLAECGVMPGTYPQKWFVAMCVHVLPFEPLMLFLKFFFERGVIFLLQFAFAFFEIMGPDILKVNSPSLIYSYLRLDPSVVNLNSDISIKIVQRALDVKLPLICSMDDVKSLRAKIYSKHFASKFDKKSESEVDEEYDDFTIDSENDSEEAEPGTECQSCYRMVPDYWCKQCQLFLCGICHNDSPGHLKDHQVCDVSLAPPDVFLKKEEKKDISNSLSSDEELSTADVCNMLKDVSITSDE